MFAVKFGIIVLIIFGMGRVIGEIMVVIMVVGNSLKILNNILDQVRILIGNIVIEMGYVFGKYV